MSEEIKPCPFQEEWDLQQGAEMLKLDNQGHEWQKTIARHFWDRATDKLRAENEALKKQCDGLHSVTIQKQLRAENERLRIVEFESKAALRIAGEQHGELVTENERLKEMLEQKGIACMKHDLTGGWACPLCLEKAEAENKRLERNYQEAHSKWAVQLELGDKLREQIGVLVGLHNETIAKLKKAEAEIERSKEELLLCVTSKISLLEQLEKAKGAFERIKLLRQKGGFPEALFRECVDLSEECLKELGE